MTDARQQKQLDTGTMQIVCNYEKPSRNQVTKPGDRVTAFPLLPAVPNAFEKLQRVGVSLQEANQIINNPAAQHVLDNLNDGNINNYQTINGQIIRITTDPSAQRIISAGIVQARNIAAGINSGRFTPAP